MRQVIKAGVVGKIEDMTGQRLTPIEIQRYFYLLQVNGVDLGYNFVLGETQPISRTLGDMLELYPYEFKTERQMNFTPEFLKILEKVITELHGKTDKEQAKLCRKAFKKVNRY